MTKRQLARWQRLWRTAVRETIKRLKLPEDATHYDVLALFDAVSDEVKIGRKIIKALRLGNNRKAVA